MLAIGSLLSFMEAMADQPTALGFHLMYDAYTLKPVHISKMIS